MKRLLLLLAALIMILSASVAFAEEDAPDSRVAKKNNVYETAEQMLRSPGCQRILKFQSLMMESGYGIFRQWMGMITLPICRLMATTKT